MSQTRQKGNGKGPVVYNLDLPIQAEMLPPLLGLVDDPTLTDAQKIGGIALRLLEDQATGGLMLSIDELRRITEATGVNPACGEDLVAVLSEATGIEEGKHVIKILIDPVWWEYYSEPAKIQGRKVEDVLAEIFELILDNDPYQYMVSGQPQLVRMTEKDYDDLQELLGVKFTTGTELAKLIQKTLGGPLAEEAEPVAEVV